MLAPFLSGILNLNIQGTWKMMGTKVLTKYLEDPREERTGKELPKDMEGGIPQLDWDTNYTIRMETGDNWY